MEIQYPLIFFTLLLCLSAGLMGFQGWLLLKGEGTKKFHMAMLGFELVALVVGGFASFLHLHHWERIFNGFMHLSSGITQELIAVVVIVLVIAITFVNLRKQEGEGLATVPKWNAILALVVGLVMGFVTAHSYDMVARPAWSNFTLYLYYYSSELLLGVAGTWAIASLTKQDEGVLKRLAMITGIAGIISAIVIIICGFFYTTIEFGDVGIAFHTTNPMAPDLDQAAILAAPFSGSSVGLFWGGAVVVGSVIAALCGFLKARKSNGHTSLALIALICALIGGVCFRVILYVVAVNFYGYF